MLNISCKNIWNFDQNNLHAFVRRRIPPADFCSRLVQNLMLEFLHFLPTARFLFDDEWMQL